MTSNKYYDLSYDAYKNQINWKVKGYWPSPDVVPDMEKDWDDVLGRARKPGFNILANLLEMKIAPDSVMALHAKVQKQLVQAGVKKVAMIISTSITRVNVKNIGTKSGMVQLSQNFLDIASGQAWLDED